MLSNYCIGYVHCPSYSCLPSPHVGHTHCWNWGFRDGGETSFKENFPLTLSPFGWQGDLLEVTIQYDERGPWSLGSGAQEDRLSTLPRRCLLLNEEARGTRRGYVKGVREGGGTLEGIWG